MTTPRAVGFRAAADARYRRTCVAWQPVASLLRAVPRLLRIESHVHIDARTLRVMGASPGGRTILNRRVERPPKPVLARLVERARRDETTQGSVRLSLPVVREATSVRVERRRRAEAPSVPEIPLILARTATSAAPVVSTSSIAARDGWPSAAAASARPAARPTTDAGPGLSRVEVDHLTERVVAAIDRRMLAARERLGR